MVAYSQRILKKLFWLNNHAPTAKFYNRETILKDAIPPNSEQVVGKYAKKGKANKLVKVNFSLCNNSNVLGKLNNVIY